MKFFIKVVLSQSKHHVNKRKIRLRYRSIVKSDQFTVKTKVGSGGDTSTVTLFIQKIRPKQENATSACKLLGLVLVFS